MPPLRTTAGQLAINRALPPDLRDHGRVLDKSGLAALLSRLASEAPDEYRRASHQLSDLGQRFATRSGGYSFDIGDLRPARAAVASRDRTNEALHKVFDDRGLQGRELADAVVRAVDGGRQGLANQIYDESLAEGNPLAYQVLSGARGNRLNLASLRGSDGLYADYHDRIVPIPIMRSFSEGLTAPEYIASMSGARKGVLATKLATADAGYFSKVLNQATHRLVVTARDEDDERDPDAEADEPTTRTLRGLPVDADDQDSVGALLAHDVGGFPRHTQITSKILGKLKDQGVERILVRSPTVGGPAAGGVYAKDVGVREYGRMARPGEFVGMTASQAIGEPLSQGQLCLARGTVLRMARGGDKPIEAARAGDMVWGCDSAGRLFVTRVVRTYDNGIKTCWIYRAVCPERGNELGLVICTEDHKVLTELETQTGWTVKPIGQCRTITRVVADVEGVRFEHLQECELELAHGSVPMQTYDIEVEHPSHLFLLANGLVVANSAKHSGGVAGAEKAVSGFKLISQLAAVPKHFPGNAGHAQRDGTVTSVEPGVAGGWNVKVGSAEHHVPAGNTPSVRPGDEVEAGDVLSDGIPNPAEIVAHKGIGEGRRYFTHAFREALRGAGIKTNRRNVELIARGLIDHVKLDEEQGEHVPGDLVSYQALEHSYVPRADAARRDLAAAHNTYLEEPVLHFTIGTHVKPSVARTLREFGVKDVLTHPAPPPFAPQMVRLPDNLRHDPDWLSRLYGSSLRRGFLDSVHRGGPSDEAGTSFVPSLARSVGFGDKGLLKAPDKTMPPAVKDAAATDGAGNPAAPPPAPAKLPATGGTSTASPPEPPRAPVAAPAAAPPTGQPLTPRASAATAPAQPAPGTLAHPLWQTAQQMPDAFRRWVGEPSLDAFGRMGSLVDWEAIQGLTGGPGEHREFAFAPSYANEPGPEFDPNAVIAQNRRNAAARTTAAGLSGTGTGEAAAGTAPAWLPYLTGALDTIAPEDIGDPNRAAWKSHLRGLAALKWDTTPGAMASSVALNALRASPTAASNYADAGRWAADAVSQPSRPPLTSIVGPAMRQAVLGPASALDALTDPSRGPQYDPGLQEKYQRMAEQTSRARIGDRLFESTSNPLDMIAAGAYGGADVVNTLGDTQDAAMRAAHNPQGGTFAEGTPEFAARQQQLAPVYQRFVAAGRPVGQPNWTDPQTGQTYSVGELNNVPRYARRGSMSPFEQKTDGMNFAERAYMDAQTGQFRVPGIEPAFVPGTQIPIPTLHDVYGNPAGLLDRFLQGRRLPSPGLFGNFINPGGPTPATRQQVPGRR